MRKVAIVLAVAVLAGLAACSNEEEKEPLLIAGIPDQDVSLLEARFNKLAEHLSEETGLEVRYVPQVDYAAVVTAFKQGDIHMAWYGGLTGVQARLAVPEAEAIAQRPRDAEFHSVFVAAPDSRHHRARRLAREDARLRLREFDLRPPHAAVIPEGCRHRRGERPRFDQLQRLSRPHVEAGRGRLL